MNILKCLCSNFAAVSIGFKFYRTYEIGTFIGFFIYNTYTYT